MSSKLFSGQGWSFEPAGSQPKPKIRSSKPLTEQVIRMRFERRVSDKLVTVLSGLELTPQDLKDFSAFLKNACGTGGTVREHTIELQGDQREALRRLFEGKNWKLKG